MKCPSKETTKSNVIGMKKYRVVAKKHNGDVVNHIFLAFGENHLRSGIELRRKIKIIRGDIISTSVWGTDVLGEDKYLDINI